MSTAITHLSTLYFSPITLKEHIIEFYSIAPKTNKNILLAYLILPLHFTPDAISFLRNAKSTSSLLTYTNNKKRLVGLQSKVNSMKDLTNQCLQMSIDNEDIIINEHLSVVLTQHKIDFFNKKKQNKEILSMVKILCNTDILTVYKQLGIKNI
ncbi:Uncharacterised protein [Cedecea lapagei]|uniref:Uncharacterized protein n=1 Tax=Cedecea lapagei TaxID=158823 RepID=A0A447UW62_9ENTR|nr:three component ABC system middle component [Cedecea lapagei]VEB94948.1 Uncharacterised protein [Cedecea lapagei]